MSLGPSRGSIATAIVSALGTPAGIVNIAAQFDMWTDVPPGNQPALRILKWNELTSRKRGEPPRRIWDYWLLIYAQVPTGTSGETVLDPLIDAVELAFEAGPAEPAQTLGNLVSHAWIEGATIVDTGDLDAKDGPSGQAIVWIPVRILVP